MEIRDLVIPDVTLGAAREWFEYMRGQGDSAAELDVLGEVITEDISLRELQFFIPEMDEAWLESVSVNDLVAVRNRFVELNPGFVALRQRVSEMGAALMKQGQPAPVSE